MEDETKTDRPLPAEVEHDADDAADAAPLTHALDAEGNALCPYDPERLGYVSQRPERVTCPACMEAAAEPAPREPSAHDELARLLPKLPLQIRFVLHGYATECEIADTAEKDLARACSLLLDERERMTAAFANLSDDRIALHAGNEAQRDISATQERAIDALRARVAELEAVLNPKAADADLVKADRDAIGRLLVIATMGGSVESAYLREVRRVREQAAKRAEEAERRVAELEAREHLTAPSPLDLAAAEVCAVPATVAGWQEAYAEIDRLTDTDPEPGDALRSPTVVARRDLTRIARVALAGMLACDAKGGSK